MLSDHEKMSLTICTSSLHTVEANPEYAQSGNPSRGKCYLAAVALLQYLGGKGKGYSLCRGMDALGMKHYWVQNADDQILDPTALQCDVLSCDPPYQTGRRVGFRGNLKRHLPLLNCMNLAKDE